MSRLLIAHDIPGRLRLRLPVTATTEELPSAILREPGVTACRWSARTRSLLVLYRPDDTDAASLGEAVARLSGAEQAEEPAGVTPPPAEAGAAINLGLREAARVLDERVQRVTRGSLGLGSLLPLALMGWAVTELVRGRTAPLAWSSALWYAHGLYRDYSLPAPRD
jgi:hypothetical protein